jgi:hypothetical protein
MCRDSYAGKWTNTLSLKYLRNYSGVFLLFTLVAACRHSVKEQVADAGVKLIPIPEQRIEAVNNATKQAPYLGATGTLEGVVTMVGDTAPDMTPYIDKIPADCSIATNTYGKLFREGDGRTVADVLVAVTGYKGYLKPKSDHVELSARDCAWAKKTVGVTFGQRLEIKSADTRPYIPQLLGGPAGALLVAVPGGDATPVFPQEPGHYVLIDSMRLYSKADVFVVRYPTFDVTGLNGRYRIEGIPVGPVTVSALLPSTSSTDARQVTVAANQKVNVDFALKFSRPAVQPQAGPSGAGQAKPSR